MRANVCASVLCMSQQPTYDPHNPHTPSPLRTELMWEGKYDEYGDRQGGDITGCAMPMQKIYERLQITHQQLTEFCRNWHIAELAVFGSILRDDFRQGGEDPSDVDILFTDGENARKNLILQVRMKFELQELLHRRIDMVSKTALLTDPNTIRRQHILESARVVYVEG